MPIRRGEQGTGLRARSQPIRLAGPRASCNSAGMRGLSILLMSFALAPPALADVDFRKDRNARDDLALITTCFDAAKTWEAAQDCVNLTYPLCLERLGRKPAHVDQAESNIRGLALWDHLLSFQERQLEAWVILKDNEIVSTSDRDPVAHENYLKSRQDWKTYRTDQCVFDVQRVAGGTAGMTVLPHCEMDLVVDRMFTLRVFLEQIAREGEP
jgi:uncharacterized protein YecT (DUF1311 family)